MKILQNWRQPLPYAVISIRYCHYKFTILYFTIQKLILSSNSYLHCSTIALIILNCYTISMDSNIITCRSQVRNPAGLRRFTSPHPSLFFRIFGGSSSLFFWIFGEIFGLKWVGNEGGGLYRGGDSVAWGGRQAPTVARWGGALAAEPPRRADRGPVCKKNL